MNMVNMIEDPIKCPHCGEASKIIGLGQACFETETESTVYNCQTCGKSWKERLFFNVAALDSLVPISELIRQSVEEFKTKTPFYAANRLRVPDSRKQDFMEYLQGPGREFVTLDGEPTETSPPGLEYRGMLISFGGDRVQVWRVDRAK